MSPELIEKIRKSNFTRSELESALNMPKNSLAGMMNGSRPTPKKWETIINEHFDKREVPVPEIFKVAIVKGSADGYDEVMDYCNSEGITLIELAEQHKSFKKELNARKSPTTTPQVRDLNSESVTRVKGGNWYQEFAKRKSQGLK